MPKVNGPLFSRDARGQFARNMIFKRGGIVVNYFKPRNPNTPAQQAQREAFRMWTVSGLTQEQADLLYAAIAHLHDDRYSLLGHDHDGDYSALGHNHDEVYFQGIARDKLKNWAVDCFVAVTQQEYPFEVSINFGSGTIQSIEDEDQHPGIYRISSAASGSNSGRILRASQITAGRFIGGEWLEVIFRVPVSTSVRHRLGWHDNVGASSNPTDGVWIDIADNVLSGKTGNNGTISTTGATYTITDNHWYRARVEIAEDLSSVNFKLYDSPGTSLLWSGSLSSNIPSASGRDFGLQLLFGKVASGITAIADIDWVASGCLKSLNR